MIVEFFMLNIHAQSRRVHVHGKYVYSTLALEKEREIVKEETALRKQYAVMLYMYMSVR